MKQIREFIRTSESVTLFFICFTFLLIPSQSSGKAPNPKNVLILFEGYDIPSNYARGDAREMAMLLGHFNVHYEIKGVEAYSPGDIEKFDFTFFIGYSKKYDPPVRFLKDAYNTSKTLVWMNTGFDAFSRKFDLATRLGFTFSLLDTSSIFDIVKAGKRQFTKGEENLNIINIIHSEQVEVLASAFSTGTHREAPYIVRSGNFIYIGDSPFASATETDRYVFFADMLHDLLGEQHEEIHRALLRIEDVDVFEDPASLRRIADAMYKRHVPFLVGIIPFFVDPEAGLRLSLSDKPDFVDAIHYMVSRGATIVMHGVTHQYRGVTATDYEFWDESIGGVIKTDSKEYVEKKLEMGLEECWKNNIYPLVWETPHYTASELDYKTFGTFFSTVMEQRMVIEDINYSQYFPFIIDHDLYGQRIIPENLGYIPLDDDPKVEEDAVQQLLKGAQTQLAVRDGFASAFIHPFIDVKYIEEYVDGILDLGYTFMDVKNENCTVTLKDRVIATGSVTYSVSLEDQYLRETWLRPNGEVDHRIISESRVHGAFRKSIEVPPGEIYLAEPSEYREMEPTFAENIQYNVKRFWNDLFPREESFDEARVAVLWNRHLTGSTANDQESFLSAFRSLNIQTDSLAVEDLDKLSGYNLLVVPYPTVDILADRDYDRIVQFVESGGNLITDGKNGVAEELGIKYAESFLKVERMRDRLFPEDPLLLSFSEIMPRFEVRKDDEIFCIDARTDAPVVIGRQFGSGKFLFLGVRFDPLTHEGYSRFPFLIDYVTKYFRLKPVLRRENLELYFDPGYRHNISVEDLVKHWVAEGVRVIHAASWHQYPTWTYDYARLISLCHANGISVYAWLEPPQVSQKFWKEHPEWQEVNYKGESVRPSWRYPVALTEPACLTKVKDTYREFLEAYDWDGVNLAELYFDSGNGPHDPKLLTPMHVSARNQFKTKNGFDPAALLDSTSSMFWKRNPAAWKLFENYRVESLVSFHEEFLNMLNNVKMKKPFLDIIITVMDNIGNPELRTNYGVDIRRIVDLNSKYAFNLQVEDPQSEWSKDPQRYEQLATRYRSLTNDKLPLMVDLNILQFRNENIPTPFPTLVQSGIESFQMIRSAALGTDRFAIYSESSVRPQDLRLIPYAASARATLQRDAGQWEFNSPFHVILDLSKEYSSLRTSNGERLRSEDGKFLLPAGRYSIFLDKQSAIPFTPPSGGQLLTISGKLTSLINGNRSITFSYNSATRCIATFSHNPYTVFVDGGEVGTPVAKGYRRFSIMLPHGEHTVNVVLETTVSYGVDLTSFWSSWVIVGFGMISGTALLTFYTVVRVSRYQVKKR